MIKNTLLLLALLELCNCKSNNTNTSSNAANECDNQPQHQYYHSDGGPLLGGYPWGVFDLQMQFNKRLSHQKNDQDMSLANRIFESLGNSEIGTVMVAFPVALDHKNYRPFGDGQSNGHADFAAWGAHSPPYIALFRRENNTVTLLLHRELNLANAKFIEWSIGAGPAAQYPIHPVSADLPNSIRNDYTHFVKVEVAKSNWEKRTGGVFAFFKLADWNDWFAVHFQNPYVSIDELMNSVPQQYKTYSAAGGSRSVPNPMKAVAGTALPPLLQLMSKHANNDYLVFPSDEVHSLYPSPNLPETVVKTVGGNWTFLLNPQKWEVGNPPDTFKQLYSCFPGRMYWEESIKKAISGTGWHHVGDPGEFLLNSIEGESRSLITALGVKVPTDAIPNGANLAYNLQYVGYSGFLEPGFAFISVKGQFHWHPVHTVTPVCIEVWRPFCDINDSNKFGMECN